MAFERAVDLYLNTQRRRGLVLLRAKNDGSTPADPPQWVQGDEFLVRLWFLEPSNSVGVAPTVVAVPAGSTIKFAGKLDPDDSTFLFLVPAFTEVGAGSDLHYEATIDLNTAELNAALASPDEITAVCDVEVRDATNTERITFRFSVSVLEQVYQGDEADPTPATPTYPAPEDIALKAAVMHYLPAVTDLTGGGATNLDGAVVSADYPLNSAFLILRNDLPEIWRLEAGTDAEDSAAGIVRPDDYAGGTNERILKRKLLFA